MANLYYYRWKVELYVTGSAHKRIYTGSVQAGRKFTKEEVFDLVKEMHHGLLDAATLLEVTQVNKAS